MMRNIKRRLLVVLLLLILCPMVVFAHNHDSDGFHFYASTGITTSSFGTGYRKGGFEIGGNISSSALQMGIVMLITNFRPLSGFLLGAVAFGGADIYLRYDLIPSSRFELSLGAGGGVTYCLFGAMDVAATATLSMRTSISTDKGIVLFLESSVPLYTVERSDSCNPSSDNASYTHSGFVYPNTPFGAKAETVITTRLGAEIFL